MMLRKIINNIFITMLFLLITTITKATTITQHEDTNIDTDIENICETCCYDINNSKSYKALRLLSNGDISNLLDVRDETKNRIVASVPTFTIFFFYYILCSYLGVVPEDSLFYFTSKLLLIDIFLSAANIIAKPNLYFSMLSMLYYLYNDMIAPIYINTKMLSSFNINTNISSIIVLSALSFSAIYSISTKTKYRVSLVARILKDNNISSADISKNILECSTANKESFFYDLIKNCNSIYLHDNSVSENAESLFIRICNWINDNKPVSLHAQRKKIQETLKKSLYDFSSEQEDKYRTLEFLKEKGLLLLSEDSKELLDVVCVANHDHKLLFEFKKNTSKITSDKLINLLKTKSAINVEINDVEDPNNYKYFTMLRGDENYYILINKDTLKEYYILNLILFFTSFSSEKSNIFNSKNYSNSIIIKYNNKSAFKEALKIAIEVFKCNLVNTEFYRIDKTVTNL